MTARCARGAWPDVSRCAEELHVEIGLGEYERLLCETALLRGCEWGAWTAWYESRPLCPPGRDEGSRP